jgi:hypothetical protein
MAKFGLIISDNCLEQVRFFARNGIKGNGIFLGERIGNNFFFGSMLSFGSSTRGFEKRAASAQSHFKGQLIGFFFIYLPVPDSLQLENRIVIEADSSALSVFMQEYFPRKRKTLLRRIKLQGG